MHPNVPLLQRGGLEIQSALGGHDAEATLSALVRQSGSNAGEGGRFSLLEQSLYSAQRDGSARIPDALALGAPVQCSHATSLLTLLVENVASGGIPAAKQT